MTRAAVLLATLATLALGSSAHAATVLSDDFNSEVPALTVTNLTNFNVTGNVDVVAAVNGYGITATSTVIDLDGTTGPGALTSKQTFNFNAGDVVTLSMVLGGAQRGSNLDDAYVNFIFGGGGASLLGESGTGLFNFIGSAVYPAVSNYSALALLPGSTPFTASSVSFTAGSAGSFTFAIGTNSGDNIGPLLDSVKLDITGGVPEPATWALMIGGFGLAGAQLRRRRAVAATA